MTALAIALVLGAALIHASWNYLLKKSGGGIGFVWAFSALSAPFYAPLAAGGGCLHPFPFFATPPAFLLPRAVLPHAFFLLFSPGCPAGGPPVVFSPARATGPP